MTQIHGLASLPMCVLCVLSLVGNHSLAEPVVRETHKDWTVMCDTPAQVGKEVCLIVQQKNLKDSNKFVLRVEVGFAVQNGKPYTVITTPLGVALAAGLSMRVDEGETTTMAFSSCIPRGCVVGISLSDAQLQAFRRGRRARFEFYDTRGNEIAVPISLQGFTAAVNALQE